MSKPRKTVTDEDLKEARSRIRSLTSTNIKKAELLSKKIDQLESAGMVTSGQEYRRKLLAMVGSKARTIKGQEEKPMSPQEIKELRKARNR